jgi:long-subunit acyl-CoA synthetase (AMP-forming)
MALSSSNNQQTTGMLLADHHKIALLLPDRSYTYAQLLSMARAYGQLIPEGTERVLIFSENRPKWIHAFYGAWGKGCTVVPVDFQATAEEVAFIARDCRPRFFSAPRNANRSLRTSWQAWIMRHSFWSLKNSRPWSCRRASRLPLPIPRPQPS